MRSKSLTFDRLNLVTGVKTLVKPDRPAMGVNILNNTPQDLEIHSTDSDDAHYVILAAGFERQFPKLHANNTAFDPDLPAFWLRAVEGGSVILIWT